MAAYYLGGIMIKFARLNVKVAATPTTACASMAHGTAAGSFDGELMMMDNSM